MAAAAARAKSEWLALPRSREDDFLPKPLELAALARTLARWASAFRAASDRVSRA